MALNGSGPISIAGTTAGESIQIELNGNGSTTMSLNDAAVRTLAGPAFETPATTIQMPTNFYGKSNRATINLTISANTYNYDVYANRGPTYTPGTSDITVTVDPGVFVGGNTPASYAMLVPSAFAAGDTVTIINNGSILGGGATGGPGGNSQGNQGGATGGTGGNSVYVNRPTTITNNGSIFSGGGGGGGGGGNIVQTGPPFQRFQYGYGGGGGGGGAGFNGGTGGGGGAGPAPGGNFPGSPGGTGTTSVAGGGGAAGTYSGFSGGAGGPAGGLGAAGSAGTPSAGGGGAGGATGYYIVGNPFVTWPATGSRGGNVG